MHINKNQLQNYKTNHNKLLLHANINSDTKNIADAMNSFVNQIRERMPQIKSDLSFIQTANDCYMNLGKAEKQLLNENGEPACTISVNPANQTVPYIRTNVDNVGELVIRFNSLDQKDKNIFVGYLGENTLHPCDAHSLSGQNLINCTKLMQTFLRYLPAWEDAVEAECREKIDEQNKQLDTINASARQESFAPKIRESIKTQRQACSDAFPDEQVQQKYDPFSHIMEK